jgi:hypothetical protein
MSMQDAGGAEAVVTHILQTVVHVAHALANLQDGR